MEVLRALVVLTCAVSVMMVAMLDGVSAEPVLHVVGGTKVQGWRPNYMNYTVDWASHEYFKVGDWLYFGYDAKNTTYDILQVNETSYQSCSSENFIKNISRGVGRDVFNLTQAKPYYFLSSGDGNCGNGMKLAILKIEDGPAPEPTHGPASALAHAPAPSKNGSPSEFAGLYRTFFTVATAMVVLMMSTSNYCAGLTSIDE